MASAELHFVFKNDKYNSVGDAVVQGDGLAVLGVILRETDSATTGVMPELFNNVPQVGLTSVALARLIIVLERLIIQCEIKEITE